MPTPPFYWTVTIAFLKVTITSTVVRRSAGPMVMGETTPQASRSRRHTMVPDSRAQAGYDGSDWPRHDLGADYYERQRDVRRQVAHHVGKLGSLGFEVTLCRIPEAEPDGTGPAQAA